MATHSQSGSQHSGISIGGNVGISIGPNVGNAKSIGLRNLPSLLGILVEVSVEISIEPTVEISAGLIVGNLRLMGSINLPSVSVEEVVDESPKIFASEIFIGLLLTFFDGRPN